MQPRPLRRLLSSLISAAESVAPKGVEWLRDRILLQRRATRAAIRRTQMTVASGPFAGMKYIDRSRGSSFLPKLVGSYEAELHDVIRELLDPAPAQIVDIGCAEGYYAVGLATSAPKAKVLAFDIDEAAQEACRALAQLNRVQDRVEVRGACDTQTLQGVLAPRSLVVCDCEGYEVELLRPDVVPALRDASLLVELHDCFVPGATDTITQRFSPTHDVRIIGTEVRRPEEYAALAGLSRRMKAFIVDEGRLLNGRPINQHWAVLVPREQLCYETRH